MRVKNLLIMLTIITPLLLMFCSCTANSLAVTIESLEDGEEVNVRELKVRGSVSDARARVTVNGIEANVGKYGTFTATILLSGRENVIEALATLDGNTASDTVTVTYIPKPVPGKSHLESSRFLHDDSVELSAGETGVVGATLETRKNGPGMVSYSILGLVDRYGEYERPLPEGMEINIEPAEFMAYPDKTYHTNIEITTKPELSSGEYTIGFEWIFEGVSISRFTIMVLVE